MENSRYTFYTVIHARTLNFVYEGCEMQEEIPKHNFYCLLCQSFHSLIKYELKRSFWWSLLHLQHLPWPFRPFRINEVHYFIFFTIFRNNGFANSWNGAEMLGSFQLLLSIPIHRHLPNRPTTCVLGQYNGCKLII